MPVLEGEDVRTATGARDWVASLLLHGLVVGGLVGAGWWSNRHHERFGDAVQTAGAVQATMVTSLPLPPRVQPKEDEVLASETPSVVPPPKAERAEPPPEPKAVPVPDKKPVTPPKTTARPPVYTPPKITPPVKNPPPNRVASGQTGGVRIAMQSFETKVGTSAIHVTDQSFGDRFGYYVSAMNRKIAAQWFTQTLDPQAQGKRVYLTFTIDRDGAPGNVHIVQSSGDRSLDQSAVRALERIDTLGPLPEAYSGNSINVQYYFEPVVQ